jgi:hypothetical protein
MASKENGHLREMPVRYSGSDAYGQVAGDVTSTVLMADPSVTATVLVMVPVPAPAGPARVMVIVLPLTTAVTALLVEVVE